MCLFFFKQKTAYEMRISDWSSDVCSSDLTVPSTPGQPEKQPMHIPLKLALFGRESGARLGAEQLVELRRPEERIAFADLAEPPVLSINRDFSAPVVVEARRGADELAFLSGHDDDPFAQLGRAHV